MCRRLGGRALAPTDGCGTHRNHSVPTLTYIRVLVHFFDRIGPSVAQPKACPPPPALAPSGPLYSLSPSLPRSRPAPWTQRPATRGRLTSSRSTPSLP